MRWKLQTLWGLRPESTNWVKSKTGCNVCLISELIVALQLPQTIIDAFLFLIRSCLFHSWEHFSYASFSNQCNPVAGNCHCPHNQKVWYLFSAGAVYGRSEEARTGAVYY